MHNKYTVCSLETHLHGLYNYIARQCKDEPVWSIMHSSWIASDTVCINLH